MAGRRDGAYRVEQPGSDPGAACADPRATDAMGV
jgi:hypothetical protein